MNKDDLIFNRKHPIYQSKIKDWENNASAYDGGEEHIKKALIKHQSETDGKFKERKKRAFYLNYPRKIANLISNYLFSTPPTREGVNEEIEKDFDRLGRNTDEIMRQVSLTKNIFGKGYVLIDNVAISGVVNQKTKKEKKLRPYTRVLTPFQVTDYCIGADGLFEWAIIAEEFYDNKNPFEKATITDRRRLWTRQDWQLFEKDPKTLKINQINKGTHKLGIVPLIEFSDIDNYTISKNIHWFEDLVRISNAILNNCSEAQMNIILQMFGIMIVPESFATVNDDNFDDDEKTEIDQTQFSSRMMKTLEGQEEALAKKLDRYTAIIEGAEESGITRIVSPQGAENKTIREENIQLKSEMFDIVGLALQSSSKQAQSAESKSWDNLNIQQGLACRAESLQQLEGKIWEFLNKWDTAIKVPKVTYNTDFSIKDVTSEIKALMDISSFELGDLGDKTVLKAIVEKLHEINPIPNNIKQEIFKSIEAVKPLGMPKQRNFTGDNYNVDS